MSNSANKQTVTEADKASVTAVLAAWEQALLRQDGAAMAALYHPQVRAFDAVMSLQCRGQAAYAEHLQQCLAMCPGKVVSEIAELEVLLTAEMALLHFLHRCGSRDADGKEETAWMRVSHCLQQDQQGRWKIIHEHASIPFAPLSGEVLFALTPDNPVGA